MKKQYTKEEQEKIIELHTKGKFTTEISHLTGRSPSGIERFLKRSGYKMNTKSRMSHDEKELIKKLYKSGLTCEDIYQKYFKDRYKSSSIMQRIVRKGGLSRGHWSKPVILDHNYFENIDTEEKAYFAGLLLADGSVLNRNETSNNSIRIELNLEDGYLIEKLIKCVKSDKEICSHTREREYKGKNRLATTNHVTFFSNKMSADLAKYGCIPNKSNLDISRINNVPKKYLSHFIRGYFDGDGSFGFDKNKNGTLYYPKISICGHHKFLYDLIKILNNIEIKTGFVDMSKYGCEIQNIRISNIQSAINFYNYIYKDSTIFMKRKKEKFELFIENRK